MTVNSSVGRPRIAIIGGSLCGLFAALALGRAGNAVSIYERSSSSLGDRGAGLKIQPDMVDRLHSAGIQVEANMVAPRVFRFIGKNNQVLFEEPTATRFTSWNRLYQMLSTAVGHENYHLGKNAVSLRQEAGEATVEFADGSSVSADIVIGADGITSTVRQWLCPEEVPRYAGYVCWRGTVSGTALSDGTRQLLADAGTYVMPSEGHMSIYPIPHNDEAGHHNVPLYNVVWYRKVASDQLPTLLQDRQGQQRTWSIPPGMVKPLDIEALNDAAERELPRAAAEVVSHMKVPFVQVIVDVQTSRTVYGRACLMGDAAFGGRPHLGAGTAKAAADAWTLAEELSANTSSIDSALQRWQQKQLDVGHRFIAANKQLGNDLVNATISPQEFSSRVSWSDIIGHPPAS